MKSTLLQTSQRQKNEKGKKGITATATGLRDKLVFAVLA